MYIVHQLSVAKNRTTLSPIKPILGHCMYVPKTAKSRFFAKKPYTVGSHCYKNENVFRHISYERL